MTTLLYDADCGFCTRTATWLGRWLRVAPLQASDLDALGVDVARAERELPAVLPSGEVRYGAAAFAAALLSGPWFLRPFGRLLDAPGVRGVAGRVYRRVAANRHRLPGGTGACQL